MDAEAGGGGRRAPRFEGEDTTPTTKLELRGWYTYGVAAEVFAVCGVGSFLPLTLEQLAREHGVFYSDRSLSCVEPRPSVNNATVATSAAVNGTVRAANYLARAIKDVDPDRCVVQVFGKEVNTASFAMFTFSAAVFFQALTLVSSSSLADHGNNRKRLLAAFGYCGAISSMLFLFLPASAFVIAPMLVIMGVVCLGCSFVVLNSFLPLLVANHPANVHFGPGSTHSRSDSELELDARFGDSGCHDNSNSSRMDETKSNKSTASDQLSTEISSKGIGLGYVAAVLMQIVSILVLVLLSRTAVAKAAKSLPMRIVLFNVGVWWAAGTHLSYKWMRHRPGPPLNQSLKHQGRLRAYFALIKTAWLQLWETVKMAVQLRQMVIFLIAWFLLSDSIATVSSTAILFAKNELKMTTVQIALMSITAISSGIAGAFAWPKIAARYGWSSIRTIVVCVICFELIPLYGMLAYIPFVKAWGVIGLQQFWEIYPLAVVHGFVMGGLSSYCRSFYGQLIPPGHEAAFYALYAFTDKGSSVIGPAIVGAVVDATGAIRMGFTFLAVLLLLPIPFLCHVRPEEGRADALAMAQTLKSTYRGSGSNVSFEEAEGLLAEQRF